MVFSLADFSSKFTSTILNPNNVHNKQKIPKIATNIYKECQKTRKYNSEVNKIMISNALIKILLSAYLFMLGELKEIKGQKGLGL